MSFNQAFHPGDWVGGYVLRRQLGRGGSGVVWEAADEGGNLFALKIIHPGIAADPNARERLQREANTVNRIRDLGVARVVDLETDGPVAFVVTELVDGVSLREHIATRGPLAYDAAVKTAAALYETLRRVHAAGVIHRDLKPSNIILGPSGPVLIDFGIAQFDEDERLTSTGLVSGTLGWVETEVVAGASPDADSDWWAWAGIVLTMITGRPPFGTGSLNAVVTRQHLNQPDVVGVPPTLARCLRAALGPRQARPTVEEVLEALEFPHKDDDVEGGLVGEPAPRRTFADADDEGGQHDTHNHASQVKGGTSVLTQPGNRVSGQPPVGTGNLAGAQNAAQVARTIGSAAEKADAATGSGAAAGLIASSGAATVDDSRASETGGMGTANWPANFDSTTVLDGAGADTPGNFEDSSASLLAARTGEDEEAAGYLPQNQPALDRTTCWEVSDRTRQIPQWGAPSRQSYGAPAYDGYSMGAGASYPDETAIYPALPADDCGNGMEYGGEPAWDAHADSLVNTGHLGGDMYSADLSCQPVQPYYFQPVRGATVVTLLVVATLCILPIVMGALGAIVFLVLALTAMAWGYARQWRELRRMTRGGSRGVDNLFTAVRFLPALLQAALALTVSVGAATLVTLGAWSLVQVNLSGNITPNPWLDILLARQGIGVVKSWSELYESVNMSAPIFLLAAWGSVGFAALVMRVGPGGWQLSQGARSLVGAVLPWPWLRTTIGMVCVCCLLVFFAIGAV